MYNLVTGLRRSGTSLMMFALRQAGIPIIGVKYANDVDRKIKNGNPNGYWEWEAVCTETGITRELKDLGENGDLIKVMFECLFKSNPILVDKIIVMMREPKKVLSSIISHNQIIGDNKELLIIKQLLDTIESFEFLRYHNLKYKIIFYEDIITNPKKQFKDICNFLNKGNPKIAASIVNPKLNRSKESKEKYENIILWENVYNWARENQIDNIINIKQQVIQLGKQLLDNKHIKTTKLWQ